MCSVGRLGSFEIFNFSDLDKIGKKQRKRKVVKINLPKIIVRHELG